MKMKKLIAVFVACLCTFCFSPFATVFAKAGFSYKKHAQDTYFDKEISVVDWAYSRDVTHAYFENGGYQYPAVKFGENGSSRSYLNAKKSVENLAPLGYTDCVDANFTLALAELPENVRFGLSFGLKNYLSTVGSGDSSFVYFTNVGGEVCLNVSNFKEGSETVLLSALKLGNVKNEKGMTSVSLDLESDGGLSVKINGAPVYQNDNANLATEGYLGFGQTGGLEVYLIAVDIRSLTYDLPTTGVSEEGSVTSKADFSNDEFNVNEWWCSSIDGYYGGGMYIEDGMLVYDNASETAFSSTHAYSNFELEVELHDLQRDAELDSAGNILRPISTYIGFAFGRDLPDANAQSAHNVSQFLYLDPRVEDFTKPAYATAVRFRTGGVEDEPFFLPDEFNFWNNDVAQDRAVHIRISVIDGTIALDLKYEGDGSYTKVYEKYIGYTPLGYVQIWSTGHAPDVTGVPAELISATNFKLDNVALTNKDDNPLTKVVSFETNKLKIPSDFAYVDTWKDSDLIDSNWDGVSAVDDFTGWYIAIGVLGGVAVALLCVLLFVRRKTK